MGGKSSGSIERPPCDTSVGTYCTRPNDNGVNAGKGITNVAPIRQQIRFAQLGALSWQGIGFCGTDAFELAVSVSAFMAIFMAIGQGCGAVCAAADTQEPPTNVSSSRASTRERRTG